RWAAHTEGRESNLHDVGALVSLVNRLARRAPIAVPAPVLVVHGEADELVPIEDAEHWRGRLSATQRQDNVPGARHHMFHGPGATIAVDAICRAIDDARHRHATRTPSPLLVAIPELAPFCAAWPDSSRHVAGSPAGRRAIGGDFKAGAITTTEPTLANIEITTRCNLGCPACDRTQRKLRSRHMSQADFRHVLTRLPHACRVVLVGLGEPLMHPEVVDFIKITVAAGRQVSLVTNAMLLDADMARALCASGLASITFSLDAADDATAARVRTGSDMRQISANIQGLIDERRRQGAMLATSAFTALSGETVDHFEAIVDFVADHGIDALMVSDLNFSSNQAHSVHRDFTPAHARTLRQALRKAVALRLPVLSVLGLEEFGLESRYLDYLLLRGDQIAGRSMVQRHCFSPWQTIPVNVDGDLTLCDCQPGATIGNIHRDAVGAWWNGPDMINHRQRMLSDTPPEACLVCPRF
ncbi:MAG: radical SAM protein, partial [Betaproteobacteria bacterium]